MKNIRKLFTSTLFGKDKTEEIDEKDKPEMLSAIDVQADSLEVKGLGVSHFDNIKNLREGFDLTKLYAQQSGHNTIGRCYRNERDEKSYRTIKVMVGAAVKGILVNSEKIFQQVPPAPAPDDAE